MFVLNNINVFFIMTKEEKRARFIEKGKKVHCNENLDYSKVDYINNRTPVIIIDHDLDENGNEYGEFKVLPCNFLKGQGHRGKRAQKISLSKRSKQEEIIERFKKVHKGENLDYSQVKYVNMHTKVKIISHDLRPDGTEYGEFWQEPAVHLKGCTHPEIGVRKQAESQKYTTEKFIELARKVHGDKYDYSKVNYINSKTKVCVICKYKNNKGIEHGEFYTSPDLFLMGKGCPKCGNHLSVAEDEIYDYLGKIIGYEKIEKRNTTLLNGKEIDIYIPEFKIGIEFNGLKWHSEEFGKDRSYHLNKTEESNKNGITLIQIFEDEYINHKDIVLEKILHIIGCDGDKEKAYGRKCIVKKIENKDEVKTFLNTYHIQGFVGYTVAYGAYYNDTLVGVMTFLNEGKTWNLNRFSTNTNYSCPGVASKLFNAFIKEYKPSEVKSFLDRRWCFNIENNLYAKLGFVQDSILSPDYRYTNGHCERIHKFNFRKQRLNKKYGLPLTMTESEMTKKLGYYKIWDCGLIKYVWKNKHGQ